MFIKSIPLCIGKELCYDSPTLAPESSKNAQQVIREFAQILIRRTAIRLAEALDLAAEFNLYAYDAYILDCARQYHTPLLSLDLKMIALAKELHITTLEVFP